MPVSDFPSAHPGEPEAPQGQQSSTDCQIRELEAELRRLRQLRLRAHAVTSGVAEVVVAHILGLIVAGLVLCALCALVLWIGGLL